MTARFLVPGMMAMFGMFMAALPPAGAADNLLMPQTKLRLTVVQWNAAAGNYQAWQAIGGEFVVSQDGTLLLPVVGQLQTQGYDGAGLAREVATRLQARMGLREKPDTTVEILEYPPVYVVGDVTTPGQYQYRTGLTVLQALALSGGPARENSSHSNDEIRLVGELRGSRDDIMRSKARIARLHAEMAGAPTVTFPLTDSAEANAPALAGIEAQERILFEARIKERDRQTKSLEELRQLLTAEINVLEQKVKAADLGVRNASNELQNVSILVDKGIAIVSRRSDLQRALAAYQADRLDQITAIMRARQGITETTRNLEGLVDKHKTEVATSMQQEQASLQRLMLNQDVAQKLLLETLTSAMRSGSGAKPIDFVLTRYKNGQAKEIAATQSTQLIPGDVIDVRLKPAPVSIDGRPSAEPATWKPLSAADAGGAGVGQ